MVKRSTAVWIAAAVVAAMLAVFLAWVLFVPAADWLARHDVGNATGASLETARNNARGNLLALTAGVAGFGALLFTASNFALQRRALALAEEGQRRTHELTEQGQVTDRYTKAIEQLGSEKLDVRIGGIYALERIARDSGRDQPTVMEVLTTFVRQHSPAGETRAGDNTPNAQRIQADIQAALTVIGRREPRSGESLNLTGAYLGGVDLTDADLTNANLTSAHMRGTNLTDADLTDADLTGVNLTNADLADVDVGKSRGVLPSMPVGWRLREDGRIERAPTAQGA